MNKNTLIDNIRTGKMLLDSLLNGLSEDQFIQPGVCGEWSVKDTVAHIIVHEKRMLVWMIETLKGVTPEEYQPYASPDKQLNALNHQIYLDNKNRRLKEVLREWESTHAQTLAWLQMVNEEDLFDANRFCLLDGEPLWVAVAANTYEHCEEHGRDIRAWREKN